MLCDLGDYEKATRDVRARARRRAAARTPRRAPASRTCRSRAASWQAHVAALLRARRATRRRRDEGARCSCARRASRAASRRTRPRRCSRRRTRPTRPTSRPPRSTKACSPSRARFDALEQTQQRAPRRATPIATSARALALAFGTRWVLAPPERRDRRHASSRRRSSSIPRTRARSTILREAYGKKGGDWDRVLDARRRSGDAPARTATRRSCSRRPGTIAWRQLGNLIRARLVVRAPERRRARAPAASRVRGADRRDASKPTAAPTPARRRPSAAGAASRAPPTSRRRPRRDRAARRPPVDGARRRRRARRRAASRRRAAAPRPSPAPPRRRAARRRVGSPAADDRRRSPSSARSADKQEAGEALQRVRQDARSSSPTLVPTTDEKVALYTKAADLYVDKFANQAEAVKAYEAILAIDPENAAADRLPPRRCTRSAATGRSSSACSGARPSACPPGAARAAKFLEIAKLATERVKKPEVCIDLWNEVLANDADERRGAQRARAALRARARTSTSSRASSRSRPRSRTTHGAEDPAPRPSSGTIYGDRLNNDEGAVDAWRTLLTLDPNDRKAQEALKKKYLTLGRWDDLEVFYAESGKWDEFIRVLEQQEAKETDAAARRSACSSRSPSSGRDKKEKPDRAARPTRRSSSSTPKQPAGRRGAHPDLHAGEQPEGARQRDRGQARSRTGRRRRSSRSPRGRRPLRGQGQGAAEGVRALPLGVRARPRRRAARATTSSAPRKATGRWDERHRGVPARRSIEADGSSGDARLAHHAAPAARSRPRRRGAARRRRARASTAPSTTPTARTPTRIAALERLYRADVALRGAPRDLREEARSHGRPGGEEGDPLRDRQALRDRDQGRRQARSTPTSRCSRTSRPTRRRSPRSTRSTGELERWEPYVDVLRRRIELDVDEAELIDLKFRLGHDAREAPRRRRGRARELPRDPLPRRAARRRARRRSRRMLENADLRAEAAAILEDDLRGARRLGEAHRRARDPRRRRGRRRQARVSSCARSRAPRPRR